MINGKTILLPLFGFPTETFKAPMIYNPWFEKHGINALVVPMGVLPEDYPALLKSVFRLTNIRGALVTMPHKVTTVDLLDEVSTTVKIAGSCNAILKRPDGSLLGDMFDGTGFVRGLRRNGFIFAGARCLVVGSGGVGSAIAASLAAEGVAMITVFDTCTSSAEALVSRLKKYYPQMEARVAVNDPTGYNLVVNATPLGMKAGDPLPIDVSRLESTTFVGEVVTKTEITPLLQAAIERSCQYQIGTCMLFEMIPAYLEFFGFGSTSSDELREVANISY